MSRSNHSQNKQQVTVHDQKAKDLLSGIEAECVEIITRSQSGVNWGQEALFAYHAMLANDKLLNCAVNNTLSFKLAMQQIAATGLTLNPTEKMAFLVPRQGKVIFEVSYRGLIKVATDSRAVDMVVAEVVYSGDRFIYRGPTAEPEHIFDPFLDVKDRGTFRGVYTTAYLATGRVMVKTTRAEDVFKARDMSAAWTSQGAGKRGPWETHFESMAIKTGIKSARKYWPTTNPVLEQVIDYLNTEGGEGIAGTALSALDGVANASMAPASAPASQAEGGNVYDHVGGQPHDRRQREVVNEQVPREQPGRTQVQPTAQAASGQGREVTRERIHNVCDRAARTRSWEAACSWAEQNLTGEALTYALGLFEQKQAAQAEAA